MTRLILLDLGKVLIDFDFEIAIRRLKKYGGVLWPEERQIQTCWVTTEDGG